MTILSLGRDTMLSNSYRLVSLVFRAVLISLLLVRISFATDSSENSAKSFFFDDFAYNSFKEFTNNGWKARTKTGHPGVKGATWSAKGITFHPNNLAIRQDEHLNGKLRLTSYTDGTGSNTQHTQICHARKYYEGTYAARVFFNDSPVIGPDGDEIIETFYIISPLKAPMDLDYSEHDFEYLANGGWGKGEHALWATSWETFQLTPWTKVNKNSTRIKSLQGWHNLLLQIKDKQIRYYVDGELFASHSEPVYPEVPMSINFNLWFTQEGIIDSKEKRIYQQEIDWVYHVPNRLVNQNQVDKEINKLRQKKVKFYDSVNEMEPKLESLCGL